MMRSPETIQSRAEVMVPRYPLRVGQPCWTLHKIVRAAHVCRRGRRREARYAAVTIAPAGSIPCTAQRQSAISSLRANAMMPTFRARALSPKRR